MTERIRKGIWIDNEIIQDQNLRWSEKALLAEILSLDKLENGCIASNQHFSKLLGVTPSAASKTVSRLVDKGYIKATNKYKNRNCIGRVIKPLKKNFYSVGVITQDSSDWNQDTTGVLPDLIEGSSSSTDKVLPNEEKGSSKSKPNNTTINTNNINTTISTETRKFFSSIEHLPDAEYNKKVIDYLYPDYPNWLNDLRQLGIKSFLNKNAKYVNRYDKGEFMFTDYYSNYITK